MQFFHHHNFKYADVLSKGTYTNSVANLSFGRY